MAEVMFAWQLGSGLGHVMRILPLARGLVLRGHRVSAALRDVTAATDLFRRAAVRVLQAPAKTDGRRYIRPVDNFAQLLGNVGFGNDGELFGLASAWRNLFRLARPDLVVFDHSPAALLAARGVVPRRVLIGTGFTCPPDAYPLPLTRSPRRALPERDRILEDEDRILRRANRMLRQWKQPPLERLGQLYGDVDDCLLTTFVELDHYPDRGASRYWGPVNGTGGSPPAWPSDSTGKRVFGYLKPFPGVRDLLEVLAESGNPTLIHPDRLDSELCARFECRSLHFQSDRPDPLAAARECDVGVLNGTHGTTCDLLLQGKPILQAPIFGEQQLMAEAVSRAGAGEIVWPMVDGREVMRSALAGLLAGEQYSNAARAFSARYRGFSPEDRREEMVDRLCSLLSGCVCGAGVRPLGRERVKGVENDARVPQGGDSSWVM